MGCCCSDNRDDAGGPALQQPNETWLKQCLRVERHDAHGGVVVRVDSLAKTGAHVGACVAKTGAWLQSHGGDVKEFRACRGVFVNAVGSKCGACLQ